MTEPSSSQLLGPSLTANQITSAYRAERRALAELVKSLSSEEWLSESACQGWTIGEVAAHCTLGDGIPWGVVRSVIREVGLAAGIERVQKRWAAEGISYVADRLRSDEVSIYLRWGFGKWRVFSLVELVIHAEDIRRPLGRQRHRPLDPALAAVLLEPMGRRVREIGVRGFVSLAPHGLPARTYEVKPGRGASLIREKPESPEPDAVISGDPLELILRLSGRPAKLTVEGDSESEFADATREFAGARSENVGSMYWR